MHLKCYNCGRSYTSHSRTCRFHLPAERVVAGGDHLWAAVCLSSCPECRLAHASFANEFSENVGLTLSRHCKERIVCGILHVTGPGDRCGNDNDQRERDAQCV